MANRCTRMTNSLRLSSILFIILFSYNHLFSQNKCGTVEYENQLLQQQRSPVSKDYFEKWLEKKKIENQNTLRAAGIKADIIIPVVVHIIHNGENIGEGINIPDEQIISQIEVLNEDFTRTNEDKSNTPSAFNTVAADIEVKFVLAKRDPEGLSTNGIMRVQGTKSTWTFSNSDDDKVLKALSYWPSEEYLNIWVTQSTWLGWAQFPVSTLEGLEDSSNNRLTDGVVIDYRSFGSIAKYPTALNLKNKYDLGRTTTHEVGHFLGLRHIWGDGGCTVDDFCQDTPTTSSENFTSDCVFPGPNKCEDNENDLPDMFQNFMDYSDDVCMNLFTFDQKSRIQTVLTNSPRRKSLITSKGGEDAVIVANDLGIKTILSPQIFSCNDTVTPQLTLRNYGSNDATQVTIEALLDDVIVQTTSYSFQLRYLETIDITLDPITLLIKTEQTIEFRIKTTNNTTDGNIDNNIKSVILLSTPKATLPLSETFNLPTKDWNFYSPEGGFNWEYTYLSHKNVGDSSIMLNCFDYDIINEETHLISPQIDLTVVDFATLSFEVAHSNFIGYVDELKVVISTDCGNTFPEINIVYAKSGDELSTTNNSWPDEFFPTSSADWRLEQIDLSDYLGKKIQIGIIGINGYGNNIFLDNVRVITSEFTDIGINSILSPSPVLGVIDHDLVFEVLNLGSKAITSFDYSITQNNGTSQSFKASNLLISPGQSYAIEHGTITGTENVNFIEVVLNNPNDTIDVDVSNNSLAFYYTIDKSSNTIPLRDSFDNTVFTVNSQYPDEIKWEQIILENNTAMFINGAEHPYNNAEEWLVSPLLDLSEVEEASLYFDVSYALPTNLNSDFFQIMVSDNNGLSYTPTSYAKSGMTLATTSKFIDNWEPTNKFEWRREYLDLTNYAFTSEFRIAFVFYNKNANALYLDNIEFYIDANPDTLSRGEKVVIGPNPLLSKLEFLNVFFDLEERQTVMIALYNQMGQPLYTEEYKNVLNQHYQLSLDDLPAGMTILKVTGMTFQLSERIVVIK